MCLRKLNKLVFTGVVTMAIVPAFGTTYLITDLGTLGGATASAAAINTNKQVTGTSATAAGSDAYLFSAGTMLDLGSGSQGLALNNLGHVAGSVAVSATEPFLFRNGTLSALGLPTGATFGLANGVNDSDQVVGEFVTGTRRTSRTHAFLWQNGTFQDLGTLGGTGPAEAFGIDDAGQIVGVASTNNTSEAFIWQNGAMKGLGLLPGGFSSSATFINNNGVAVGSASASNGVNEAAIFENGNVVGLGLPPGAVPFAQSTANAINNNGVVVGSASTSGRRPTVHAFIVQNGVMIDLTSRIPGNSGSWIVQSANGITDDGIIVGTGTTNGVTHAFLLSPTTAVTVPAAPTGLTAQSSNAVVNLTWLSSFGATSYNVMRSTSSSGPFTSIGTVAGTSFTDASVDNCTVYTYVVTASNSAGQSPDSAPATGVPESVPSAPTDLTATPNTQANLFDGSAIVLAWVNNTTSCEQQLNIERSTDGVNFQFEFSVGPNQGSIVDGFLPQNTRFFYRLRAVSTGGESVPSNVASAVSPNTPN